MLALILALMPADIKKPAHVWLGGQREVLLGITEQKTVVLGFYVFIPRPLPGEAPDEMRVGHVTTKTSPDSLFGEACAVIETDGRRVQHLGEVRALDPFNPMAMEQVFADQKRGRRCWITGDGRMLRQWAFEYAFDGTYESEALFNKDDTISLTLRRNGQETNTVLLPEGGVSQFHSEYVPMVKDGKIVQKEKSFAVLDARGHLTKWKAKIGGRFTGSILFIKYEGVVLDLESGGKTSKAFISDAGELLKVSYPDKSAAMVEVVPGPTDGQASSGLAQTKKATLSDVKVRPVGG